MCYPQGSFPSGRVLLRVASFCFPLSEHSSDECSTPKVISQVALLASRGPFLLRTAHARTGNFCLSIWKPELGWEWISQAFIRPLTKCPQHSLTPLYACPTSMTGMKWNKAHTKTKPTTAEKENISHHPLKEMTTKFKTSVFIKTTGYEKVPTIRLRHENPS